MQTYPFENLLYFLGNQYGDREFSKNNLEAAQWPIPLHYLTKSGLRAKGRYYLVRDLIAIARMHSIPGEGLYFGKVVTPSQILKTELDANGKIKTVHIAAGWIKSPFPKIKPSLGQLTFLCPFCGNLHFHGAGGPFFGDGDGQRVPHCLTDNPDFMRRDFQPVAKNLADFWKFYLVETDNLPLLGDVPAVIQRRLAIRNRVEVVNG